MKCLVVGLGSMGRRRVANLKALGVSEMRGFDARADRRQEASQRFGIRCETSFEAGMDWHPDAVVISTPPDDHVGFASAAADAKAHFFAELSINPEGLAALDAKAKAGRIVAAPSCTARFNPVIRHMRTLIEDGTIGRPTNLLAYLGQYLPNWHPWENHRDFFASRRRTGACRELLAFDLLWLPWLLGPVDAVSCMRASLGSLDVDIDDVYGVLLRFRQGTCATVQLDAVSRQATRYYRFVSDAGVMVWDWTTLCLRVYTEADKKWNEFSAGEGFAGYSIEDVYLDEMRAFLGAIRGDGAFPYSLAEDLERTKLLSRIDESAEAGRQLPVQGTA